MADLYWQIDEEDEESEDEGGDRDPVDHIYALECKLDVIKKNQDIVIRETAVMQAAFTHVDSKIINASPKIRMVHKVALEIFFVGGKLN